jgi:hypothetical protein
LGGICARGVTPSLYITVYDPNLDIILEENHFINIELSKSTYLFEIIESTFKVSPKYKPAAL